MLAESDVFHPKSKDDDSPSPVEVVVVVFFTFCHPGGLDRCFLFVNVTLTLEKAKKLFSAR